MTRQADRSGRDSCQKLHSVDRFRSVGSKRDSVKLKQRGVFDEHSKLSAAPAAHAWFNVQDPPILQL